ncbi:MAG: flagellar biosynthesis protein FlhA [Aureliella sp.]
MTLLDQAVTAISKHRGLILPFAVVACIGILLVPLPPSLMDGLIVLNIATAMIILLTTVYVRKPLEFSVFPTLLVATTLFRLVLNVGTTRLILTRGANHGDSAAGGVIRAFGDFVAGEVLIVGVVIFTIIVLIQFLVITKGATRVSEVAARFALDAMPGRQMAIDADLNAGVITDEQARELRNELTAQSDFYGTMDGASKFVRGDAIAGICITFVNILGGLAIGSMDSQSIGQSVDTFTRLTIGDGLSSQLPSFLISVSAAMLVTRGGSQKNLSLAFTGELFRYPEAMALAGGFLCMMIFTGMPTLPMLAVGGLSIGIAILMRREQQAKAHAIEQQKMEEQKAVASRKAAPEDLLAVDPLRVSIGAHLLRLANPKAGGDLLEQIASTRAGLASEMGFLLPQVRLKDNLSLPVDAYEVLLSGEVIGQGRLKPDGILILGHIEGRQVTDAVRDPATGTLAHWVDIPTAERLIEAGYDYRTPSECIAAHLQSLSIRYADELLTREQTKRLVEQLSKTSPAIVEELVPNILKLSQVQQVLQWLLEENIPIRQLGLILESLADCAPRSDSPVALTQAVRNRLSRTICRRFANASGVLNAVTLDGYLEEHIASNVRYMEDDWVVAMSPSEIDGLCGEIQAALDESIGTPVLLVRPNCRLPLRQIIKDRIPDVAVLSHSELTMETKIESTASISHRLAAA